MSAITVLGVGIPVMAVVIFFAVKEIKILKKTQHN